MARLAFLALIVLLFIRVFWRLFRSILIVRRPQSGAGAVKPSVHMVRDPVCGTFVLPDRALTLADKGRAVHFCSPGCRDAYQARLA